MAIKPLGQNTLGNRNISQPINRNNRLDNINVGSKSQINQTEKRANATNISINDSAKIDAKPAILEKTKNMVMALDGKEYDLNAPKGTYLDISV